jgi:hypothetical protein
MAQTIPITIQSTVINFPSSGSSPNWSEAVIQFAEAVAAALALVVGPFDVAPQTFVMTSNANTNVALPNLTFPPSDVQGAVIQYSVLRQTNGASISISNISVGNPTTITTLSPHGLVTGDATTISGSNSTPSVNGTYIVTVMDAYNFTIPVDVTVAGNTGLLAGSLVLSQTGQLIINYNSSFPTNQKWAISNDFVGNAEITFSVTDVGQLQFSTVLMSGPNYTGSVIYQAKAILNS